MKIPDLIPLPREIRVLDPVPLFACPPVRESAANFADRPAGAYRLSLRAEECRVEADDPAGFFYARQTLGQLFRSNPPALEIEDYPDYPVRGLYHDITRGKVPSLATLKQLASFCAHHKLNQLQLYIEHTYAYAAFPEVWADADPLTADEIRELDAHCAALHIELVPSFSTFGHFYPFIHTRRFQHLNEYEFDVSGDPFNWLDQMGHYTLDCRNPESIELVRTLIQEVRPLFRSDKFNICCDETFDLGKGRNRQEAETIGSGELYYDFVRQILEIVRDCGATPMMWGDIVGKHPELARKLPMEVLMLDWDYGPDLKHSIASLMRETGRAFYVCSGTSGWRRMMPDLGIAHLNITRFAQHGAAQGATGYLVTDWGDYGHIGLLSLVFPSYLLAADCAWNLSTADLPFAECAARISRLEFGDASARWVSLLREAGDVSNMLWPTLAFWKQPRSRFIPETWFDAATGLPDMLFNTPPEKHRAAFERLSELRTEAEKLLPGCAPRDARASEELRLSLHIQQLFEALALQLWQRRDSALPLPPGAELEVLIPALTEAESALEAAWMRRNKRSEYPEIQKVWRAVVADLEAARNKVS